MDFHDGLKGRSHCNLTFAPSQLINSRGKDSYFPRSAYQSEEIWEWFALVTWLSFGPISVAKGSRYYPCLHTDHMSTTEIGFGRDLLGCHLVSVFWPQKRAGETWDGTSVLSAFPGNLFLQASDTWGDAEPERHFSFKVELWPIGFAHFSALSSWMVVSLSAY